MRTVGLLSEPSDPYDETTRYSIYLPYDDYDEDVVLLLLQNARGRTASEPLAH